MERERISPEDLRKTYEQAIREPGICEVMAVYQRGMELQRAAAPYMNTGRRRYITRLARDSVAAVQRLDRS